MAFTYTSPANSDADAVRWWIGDTDSTDVQLSDAEIQYALDTTGTVYRAAAWCARALKAKYSREINMRVGAGGEFRVDLSRMAQAYDELAEFLESRAIAYVAPWAAAISLDEKEAQEDDDDRVKPFFDRSLFAGKTTSNEEMLDWNKFGAKG